MSAQNPDKFASFADFIAAVVRHEVTGERDPRLTAEAAASGQNESNGSLGGFLVPEEISTVIWSRVYATGRILSRCDRQPVGKGDQLSVPAIAESSREDGEGDGSRFGGARMFWTDEAGPADDSRFKFEMLKFKLHKLLGLVYASDELIEDATALAAAITRVFGLEAAFAIEDAVINGDGIAKPLGVMNSPCLITVEPAGALTAADLHAMAARLWGPSHATAIWLMSNEVFAQVLAIDEDTGGSLLEASDVTARKLLQMPLELCEYTPAMGSAGNIILGDFSQYLIAEKAPKTLSSLHFRFQHDETAIKVRYRVDGMPGWKTPIMPRNASDPENEDLTQSPFVALGAPP